MSHPSRVKGAAFEQAVAEWLRDRGYPEAERRVMHGLNDMGDIAGVPDLVIEAKNCHRLDLRAWLDETEHERLNAGEPYGVLVVKRSGTTDVGQAYAVDRFERRMELHRELLDLRAEVERLKGKKR